MFVTYFNYYLIITTFKKLNFYINIPSKTKYFSIFILIKQKRKKKLKYDFTYIKNK